MFDEDAVTAARELEITLTARNKEDPDAVPMCGVPHHAVEGYIRRLLDMGRKIAIAEQVEDDVRLEAAAGKDVTSSLVGHCVLEQLRGIDEVAYMRFASVYKNFDDAADFRRELALLKKN